MNIFREGRSTSSCSGLSGSQGGGQGKFKYELPAQVAGNPRGVPGRRPAPAPDGEGKLRFTPEQVTALRQLLACEAPDWEVLFDTYNVKKTGVLSFLMSEEFLNILLEMCREKYPYIAFSELFHTVRSMLLPLLYLIQQEVPRRTCITRRPPATAACWGRWRAGGIIGRSF